MWVALMNSTGMDGAPGCRGVEVGSGGGGAIGVRGPRRPGPGEERGVEAEGGERRDVGGGGAARAAVDADGHAAVGAQRGVVRGQLGLRAEAAVRVDVLGG